jgi:hypothetical protein
VEVVGQTGRSTGDRVVLSPQEREDDPAVQRRLAVDYERAMQRAFDEAARRIHTVLRPLARLRRTPRRLSRRRPRLQPPQVRPPRRLRPCASRPK